MSDAIAIVVLHFTCPMNNAAFRNLFEVGRSAHDVAAATTMTEQSQSMSRYHMPPAEKLIGLHGVLPTPTRKSTSALETHTPGGGVGGGFLTVTRPLLFAPTRLHLFVWTRAKVIEPSRTSSSPRRTMAAIG